MTLTNQRPTPPERLTALHEQILANSNEEFSALVENVVHVVYDLSP